MTVGVNVELPSDTTGCFACTSLPTDHPDRTGCLCRSPVGLPFAVLVIAGAPVELALRLVHLLHQLNPAGGRKFARRKAKYQRRWDRGDARNLQTTELYERAELGLRRAIETTARALHPSKARKPKSAKKAKKAKSAKSTPMSCRRAKARRAPGRAPRPATRRAASQLRAADGGGGDPPSGDPDPAPAAGVPGASAISLKIGPVITGDRTFSRGRSTFSDRENTFATTTALPQAFAERTRLASAAAFAVAFSTVLSATPGPLAFPSPTGRRKCWRDNHYHPLSAGRSHSHGWE